MSPVVMTKKNVKVDVDKSVSVLELPETFSALFDKLQNVKTARKALDKMEKDLKAELLEILPARSEWKTILEVSGTARAALTQSVRNSTDTDALRTHYPEVFSATLKETPVETLTMV